MADPLADLFIGAAALVAVGIPLVYVLSCGLKIKPPPVALDDPRREIRVAILVTVLVYAARILPLLFPSGGTAGLRDPCMVDQDAVTHALHLAQIVDAAWDTGPSWGKLGICRITLGSKVVLGRVPRAL